MRIGQTSIAHFVASSTTTVIGFLGTIYFARVLGASILGQYFLLTSLVVWLLIPVRAGIPTAVMKRISEQTEMAAEFVSTAVLMQLTLLILVSTCVLVFAPVIESLLGIQYVYIVPLILFARTTLQFIQNILNGQHKVHLSSFLGPTDMLSRVCLQAVLVYLGWQLGGLIMGYIFGAIMAVVTGIHFTTIRPARPTMDALRSLFDFAKYSWLARVKGVAHYHLDTIVLGIFVLPSFVGIYSVAWNISSIFAIFGESIRQAMFPKISESSGDRAEQVSGLLNDSLAFTGIFAIPGLVGVLVIGDVVLSVYGPEFVSGQMVLAILTVTSVFSVYEGQFMSALDALNYPDRTFRIQLIYLGTNITLNIAFIALYGWIGAAIATTAAAILSTALGYRSLIEVQQVNLPYRFILKQVASAIVMGIIIFTLRRVIKEDIVALLVLVPVGVAVYFGMLTAISPRFRNTTRQNFSSLI